MHFVFLRPAFLVIACALAAMHVVASAQSNSRTAQELYAGALLDHTITVAGHDFFQQFSALWREQPLNERYLLSIHEQPSARRGTAVWIEYDGGRMFQAVLPASRSRLTDLVREANQLCYQNVIDAEVRKLMFREADFAPDEI